MADQQKQDRCTCSPPCDVFYPPVFCKKWRQNNPEAIEALDRARESAKRRRID